jgi:hypothetical protein
MRLRKLVCIFLLIIAVAGCEKERVYENIYDGLHRREEIVNPSDDPVPAGQPSYDAYKKEPKL